MINLLKSNFYRVKKIKSFLIILFLFTIFYIMLYFNNYTPNCVNCPNQLGEVFFDYTFLICLLTPIFICIFINSDYNNGTIRNKIISGYSKTNIYLANLITTILVSLLYMVIAILTLTIISFIFNNSFIITPSKFIYLFFNSILLNISICSIFNFITMSISTKNLSSIYSLSLTIMALVFTSNLPYKISISSGIKKQILTFMYDFIPFGQAYQIVSLTDNYLKISLYSIILIIIVNILGINIFKNKQIN